MGKPCGSLPAATPYDIATLHVKMGIINRSRGGDYREPSAAAAASAARPRLSLRHPAAVIMDTMETAELAGPDVRPGLLVRPSSATKQHLKDLRPCG